MTEAVNVTVDHDRCVGTGSCVAIAPGVFALDENRLAIVTDSAGEPLERILDAVDQCPVAAVRVIE